MLSVVLATYNEEKNIEKCLRSIIDIADEIIVVDGSSSDMTAEIAKGLGAKVYKTTNKKNFHINKQMAMDKAKGDLVLQLDADEIPDKELKIFIINLIKRIQKGELSSKNITSQNVAWWLKRKNYFLGTYLKKGGQYPDSVIRLYINGHARLPQKDVHEQMVVDGSVGEASGHLIHNANPTFSDYLRKFNTYTAFKAEQLKDQKLKISLLSAFEYIFIKPIKTFILIFFRHKGFIDGIPGFVFALMSGLHHTVAFLMYWEKQESNKL